MGEILGLGMSHVPPLAGRDENMSGILRGTLRDPAIPAELKEPSSWPKLMQEEWGTDQGKAKAAEHRQALLSGLAKVRSALDESSGVTINTRTLPTTLFPRSAFLLTTTSKRCRGA